MNARLTNCLRVFAGSAAALWLAAPCMAQEKLFAAPTAANTATTPGASLGQMTFALAIVLVVVFAAAWVLKQTRKLSAVKGEHGIQVLSQVALGAKERAVLLKVGAMHVLVGVAPGQVNALHVAVAPAQTEPQVDVATTTEPAAAHSFQAILKRSLGLS